MAEMTSADILEKLMGDEDGDGVIERVRESERERGIKCWRGRGPR